MDLEWLGLPDAAYLLRVTSRLGVAALLGGLIGAGTILKKTDSEDIQGLTTAATIWLTAGIGAAAGAGQGWMALICVLGAWLILTILSGVSRWLHPGP